MNKLIQITKIALLTIILADAVRKAVMCAIKANANPTITIGDINSYPEWVRDEFLNI